MSRIPSWISQIVHINSILALITYEASETSYHDRRFNCNTTILVHSRFSDSNTITIFHYPIHSLKNASSISDPQLITVLICRFLLLLLPPFPLHIKHHCFAAIEIFLVLFKWTRMRIPFLRAIGHSIASAKARRSSKSIRLCRSVSSRKVRGQLRGKKRRRIRQNMRVDAGYGHLA